MAYSASARIQKRDREPAYCYNQAGFLEIDGIINEHRNQTFDDEALPPAKRSKVTLHSKMRSLREGLRTGWSKITADNNGTSTDSIMSISAPFQCQHLQRDSRGIYVLEDPLLWAATDPYWHTGAGLGTEQCQKRSSSGTDSTRSSGTASSTSSSFTRFGEELNPLSATTSEAAAKGVQPWMGQSSTMQGSGSEPTGELTSFWYDSSDDEQDEPGKQTSLRRRLQRLRRPMSVRFH